MTTMDAITEKRLARRTTLAFAGHEPTTRRPFPWLTRIERIREWVGLQRPRRAHGMREQLRRGAIGSPTGPQTERRTTPHRKP